MTNAGASSCADLDIFLCHPNAVTKRHMRPEQPKLFEVLDRRRACALKSIFLLIGGF